ncbi:ABC transporter permease [Dehalococcoidia bacterium]|nr:ABC transporter permease [Dehalococcoidia bacterium]
MRTYVVRRLLLLIPTLFILSNIVFFSVRFIPGDAVDAIVGSLQYTESVGIDEENLRRLMGLDVPAHVQYSRWMKGMFLEGTLGNSLIADWTVEEKIVGRLPVTFQLGIMSMIIALLIALPIGVYSAMRQDTAIDYAGRSVAIVGLATPNFWLAIMVMIYPPIWWGWSPPMAYVPISEDLVGNISMLIIPSVILGTASAAAYMRMTRTMMLEVLRQDYIRTAWAKGLNEKIVVVRHAIKNALIPVVTLIGMQIPILVGGSVIIENIFNLPGLGRLFINALNDRDYPTVSGINIVFGCVVMVSILITDLIYPYLDPRVRYN